MSHYSSHEENRKKVWAPCGKKIVVGKKTANFFHLTEKHVDLIKKYMNDSFSLSDSKFPLSICVTCRLTLADHEKGIVKSPLPVMMNYKDIQLLKGTRSTDCEIGAKVCSCYICLTGRSIGHPRVHEGRGHMRLSICNQIDASNGMYVADSSNGEYLKIENVENRVDNAIKLCKNCFEELRKGKRHSCGRPNSDANVLASKNITLLVEKLPEKQKMQMAHSILKQKVQMSSNHSSENIELKLNTKGKGQNIVFVKLNEKQVSFSSESLDNFQTRTGWRKLVGNLYQ